MMKSPIIDMSPTDIRATDMIRPGWSQGTKFILPQGDETRRKILGVRRQRELYRKKYGTGLKNKIISDLALDK